MPRHVLSFLTLGSALGPALALAAAACGDVKTHGLADAGSGGGGDSGLDSGGSGAGVVRVRVLDNSGSGSGLVGAQVVFTDDDRTQLGITDGSGFASATVGTGAMLTVIGDSGDEAFLQTVMGVHGGDDILLGVHNTPAMSLGSLTVSAPAFTGAGGYTFYGPCGQNNSTSPSVTLTMSSSCLTDPQHVELLAVAFDTNGNAAAYIDNRNIAYASGESVSLTGSYAPLGTLSVIFTGAGSASSVSSQVYAPDRFGFQSGDGANLEGGSGASFTLRTPRTSTLVVDNSIGRTSFGQQDLVESIDPTSTSYSLDVSASVLPWIGVPSIDFASHQVIVPIATDGTSGDAPDLGITELFYQLPRQGGPTLDVAWLIFQAAAGDTQLPTLPEQFSALQLTADAQNIDVEAGEFDAFDVDGYDAARQQPYQVANETEEDRAPGGRMRESFNSVEINEN